MAKENLMYFVKDNDERGCYPARNFLGVDMHDADTMHVSFAEEDGTADAVLVALTIVTGKAQEACEVLASALAKKDGRLTVVADADNDVFMYPFTAIESIA